VGCVYMCMCCVVCCVCMCVLCIVGSVLCVCVSVSFRSSPVGPSSRGIPMVLPVDGFITSAAYRGFTRS
jgi:hypothetical protein